MLINVGEKRWKNFPHETSIHGIRFFPPVNNKKLIWRIFWIILTFVMVVACLYISGMYVRVYYDYAVTTTIVLESKEELTLPKITFCNMNLFRRSEVGSNSAAITFLTILSADNFDTIGKDVDRVVKNISE